MNSLRTRIKKQSLGILLVLLSLFLTGCTVDTLPEWVAGKVIQAILYRDRDLFYYETASVPEIEEPSLYDGQTITEPSDIEEQTTEFSEEVEPEEPEEKREVVGESYEPEEDDGDTDDKAYYFSTLESADQKLYLEIYNAILNMDSDVEVSTDDVDEVDRIFNLCMMDHPEFFYCDGYKSVIDNNEDDKPLLFSGRFNCTAEERKSFEDEIKTAVDKILSGVPDDDSDYERVKYVFEWIVNNTEYDTDAPDNQNIKSVFLNGSSVCQGYTMAMKYLLDKMGIFCTVVYGHASDETHAWNLVKMDGTYCYVDTTWGDSSYRTQDNTQENRTSYNYFGCNSDILLRTHTILDKGKLPECTSLDEYYYVKESKYFTSVDKARLKALFEHEAELGEHMFTIRASTQEVYDQLYDALFNQRMIFDLVPDADSVTYIEDDVELTYTFTV